MFHNPTALETFEFWVLMIFGVVMIVSGPFIFVLIFQCIRFSIRKPDGYRKKIEEEVCICIGSIILYSAIYFLELFSYSMSDGDTLYDIVQSLTEVFGNYQRIMQLHRQVMPGQVQSQQYT